MNRLSDAGQNPFGECQDGHQHFRGGCPYCAADMQTEIPITYKTAFEVVVGDVLVTMASDTGLARVVALHPAQGRVMAELDNGRSTYLDGSEIEVVIQ